VRLIVWSVTAVLDLAVALSVEPIHESHQPGLHNVTGMIDFLTLNLVAAGLAIGLRR
jgi:hypothetical protein